VKRAHSADEIRRVEDITLRDKFGKVTTKWRREALDPSRHFDTLGTQERETRNFKLLTVHGFRFKRTGILRSRTDWNAVMDHVIRSTVEKVADETGTSAESLPFSLELEHPRLDRKIFLRMNPIQLNSGACLLNMLGKVIPQTVRRLRGHVSDLAVEIT
jgi:hypothetical protein